MRGFDSEYVFDMQQYLRSKRVSGVSTDRDGNEFRINIKEPRARAAPSRDWRSRGAEVASERCDVLTWLRFHSEMFYEFDNFERTQ